MAFQILLNIGIAFLWILLRNDFTVIDFLVGYFIGFIMLFVLRGLLNFEFYGRRVYAFFKLIVLFIYKLILANIDVIKIVLSPKMDIRPGIIAVPTDLDTEWEITLLATMISLTPGTLSMNFSENGKTIYVHFIHIEDKDEAIKEIHDSFEKAILEVTK
ncbi:multicomponent Na+:H+ antiporter subunit E [Evansella vedderi]|uniref:Multicomponent Na+:H+ antiporter subunit E n=1 Tax=Evansella vedderi TaxID=38282 RepID=A0ABT9ZSZ5_9BACI|nr:Na+/H+ antiporter subunit E [Evansella vedderi]MDQ0254314.1 multicomponent Na+:H+ antiporter subunit E [Evansella vedderi]